MSEYIPTTEEVRRCYGDIHCSDLNAGSLESHECPEEAEFDRWLANVKAEAWDEGYAVGFARGYGDGKQPDERSNPYREETE